MMGIYKITNKVSQKVYIGSAKDIRARELEHFRELRSGFHANRHLQYAFNKYMEGSFIHEILEEVNEEKDLLKREAFWINKYKALDSNFGYNTCPPLKGGESNREFREKVEGERNGRVLIRAKDVPVICNFLNKKIQRKEIADMFGVSIAVIEGIKSGRRWRDLSQVYLSDEVFSTWRIQPSPRGLHPDDVSFETLKLICNEINNGGVDEEVGDRFGMSDAAIACIRKGGCRSGETIHLLDDEVLRLWPYNIQLIKHLIDAEPQKPQKHGFNRVPPETIEKICHLINQKKTNTEISKQVGISPKTVAGIRNGKSHRKYSVHFIDSEIQKNWDKKNEPPIGATEYITEICKMLNAGEKRTDIAKRFNVSLSAIREIHNGKTHRYISSTILNQDITNKWNY